ncbi:hypothetical protein P280DRAFT_474058, partial [Massarina eburnea CBS 473.64]
MSLGEHGAGSRGQGLAMKGKESGVVWCGVGEVMQRRLLRGWPLHNMQKVTLEESKVRGSAAGPHTRDGRGTGDSALRQVGRKV